MSELGDVLEAMNAAPRGFDILLGEISSFHDMDVVRQGLELDSAGVATAITASPRELSGPTLTRLWLARDGRFRVERGASVQVFDGQWVWSDHGEYVFRQPPPDAPRVILGEARFLVDPVIGPAMTTLSLRGRERVAGHDCSVVDAIPRDRAHHRSSGGILMGAELMTAYVHVPTGVSLRVEGFVQAQLAMRIEFEAVAFDAPLMHDPFVFEVDDGVPIRSPEDVLQEMRGEAERRAHGVIGESSRAVVRAMPPRSRAISLADLYMVVGPLPDDPDAARTEVSEVVEHMSDLDDDGGLFNVQGGSNLGEAVQAAGRGVGADGDHPATFVVDDILFVRADEAIVSFRVVAKRVPGGFAQTGRVIKVGERWLVERATLCNLLGMAGVQCPPPPDEP